MIYRCWHCGWRINGRRSGEEDNPRIGRHMIWNSHPFHDEGCIEDYKKENCKTGDNSYEAPTADYTESGRWGEWKKERKIGRIRRTNRWYNTPTGKKRAKRNVDKKVR